MVGYGDGPVAPVRRARNEGAGILHGIHGRHIAVHVKFNALLRRVVRSDDLFYLGNGCSLYDKLTLVPVRYNCTAYNYGETVFEALAEGSDFLHLLYYLHGIGTRVILYVKGDDLASAVLGVPYVEAEDIAPDNNSAVIPFDFRYLLRLFADFVSVDYLCGLKIKRYSGLYVMGF